MQLALEELPSALFLFFCGALGFYCMDWMKHRVADPKTQQHKLQKKLASISKESKSEQASENASYAGEGNACEMDKVNEDSKPGDPLNIGGCNSYLVDKSVSLQAEMASPQEAEASCKFRQQPVEWCQGSENDEISGEEELQTENVELLGEEELQSKHDETLGEEELQSENDETLGEEELRSENETLGEEELRQLLGEWPETETEESCNEFDTGGFGDDSSNEADNQLPLGEDWPCLHGCNTAWEQGPAATGSCAAPRGRGRGRRNRRRARTRRRARASGRNVQVQDNWLVPFENLMDDAVPLLPPVQQHPLPPAAGPLLAGAVCIWKAPSDGCGNTGGLAGHLEDEEVATLCGAGETADNWRKEEIFTDGQKVFQSVPSATGQSLFTDGEQLYAAVCVIFPPNPQ